MKKRMVFFVWEIVFVLLSGVIVALMMNRALKGFEEKVGEYIDIQAELLNKKINIGNDEIRGQKGYDNTLQLYLSVISGSCRKYFGNTCSASLVSSINGDTVAVSRPIIYSMDKNMVYWANAFYDANLNYFMQVIDDETFKKCEEISELYSGEDVTMMAPYMYNYYGELYIPEIRFFVEGEYIGNYQLDVPGKGGKGHKLFGEDIILSYGGTYNSDYFFDSGTRKDKHNLEMYYSNTHEVVIRNTPYNIYLTGYVKYSRVFSEYWGWQLYMVIIVILIIATVLSVAIAFTNAVRIHMENEQFQKNLTNGLAHDLKTPLMILSGYAECLRDNINTEKKEYYAGAILENVTYINDLISDVLRLAKVEDVKSELEYKQNNIMDIAQNCLKKYEPIINEKGLKVDIDGECTIEGDEALLKQMLDNLISNSVKYSPENGLINIKLKNNNIFLENDAQDKQENGLGLKLVESICKIYGFSFKAHIKEQKFIVEIGCK